MAIASIPSFNLTAKSSPLCFNFHITGTKPLFTSSYAKFGSLKKNPIQISVCKAVVSSSLSFRDLDADDFRHPLDKQNTLLLKAIPGLNEIGKALLGCVRRSLLFTSSYAKFGSLKKNPIQISVCKAVVSSSLSFRDLDADDFRHPLDKQNTLLLKAIPGLNEIGKALLWSITEQVMVLENIGTSVLVSENQLSELHQLMIQSAEALKIEAPDLYVRQSPVPNAYTLAINGKKPFCCCSYKPYRTSYKKGAAGIGGMIAQNLEEQLFRWLRAAELTCDRAALLVVQDPKRCNITITSLFFLLENAQTRQLSHPLPVLRAREIDEWSRSQEYKSLMKRAISTNSVQKV
ncbi:putative CAAX prenyl protease 1 [Helianthus annuus]|nr:putative CAAX prenyl protease 1 [Helianthus annuus]